MNKIFLSPERRPAPHGKYWGMDVYEHDVCCEIADRLKTLLEYNGFEVYIAPPSWTMEQRASYANCNSFDYYLCIHTNAAGNGSKEGTATGCECLYYGKPGGVSYKANRLVYDEITKLYPSKRGLKDGNAYLENRLTKMVSVYAELAFHDNGNDARWLVEHKCEIAEALGKGICNYWNVKFVSLESEQSNDDELVKLKARIAQLETQTQNQLKQIDGLLECIYAEQQRIDAIKSFISEA